MKNVVSIKSLLVTIIATILFRVGLVTLAVNVVATNYQQEVSNA